MKSRTFFQTSTTANVLEFHGSHNPSTFTFQVIKDVGLCITLYDIRAVEGGFVFPGDGAPRFTVFSDPFQTIDRDVDSRYVLKCTSW